MNPQDQLAIVNMRSFFNREILMHSIGDHRFGKPVALKTMLYTIFFLLAYSLPMILIFGLKFNVIYLAAVFVPPIALGRFANRPIWGGRTLIDFIKITISFVGEPKGWTDHKSNNELGKAVYTIDHDIWVSRRREHQLLAGLDEERRTGKKTNHRVVGS